MEKPSALAQRHVTVLLVLATAGRLWAQTNLFPMFQLESAREYLHAVSQMVEVQAGTNVEAQFINARLESELGHKAEAERLARRALQLEPKRADIQEFLADLFIRQDRLDDAAQALRQALVADPQSKGVHRRLGMVLERLGDSVAAQNAIETAVRTNPDDALARLLLGRMRLKQGRMEAAKTELVRACQLDPQSPNAHYALFQVHTQLGEQEAAQKTLQRFRELKKEEKSAMDAEDVREYGERDLRRYAAEFHNAIASQLLRQGQEGLAEAHLRQASGIAPQDPEAAQILTGFYLKRGRLSEAKQLLAELVRLNPRDVASRLNLGTVLLQLQDPEAVSELKRVLELDPKQPQALHNLARFYLSTRQEFPEALSLCQRLVTVQPAAINYDLLGWAFFANGRTNEALAAAAEAVKNDPTNATYRQRYDRLRQAAGVRP